MDLCRKRMLVGGGRAEDQFPTPAQLVHEGTLLPNRKELDRIVVAVERKGYTLVVLKLYWYKGRAKLEIGLAKGKKQHDKRASDKDRDWQRQKARILKAK